MKKNTSINVDLTWSTVLAIVFLVLKLTDVIDWSWVWILSPMWIPMFLWSVILFIFRMFLDKRWDSDLRSLFLMMIIILTIAGGFFLGLGLLL